MTAFDMDYLTNPNVQKAFADLSSLLGEIGIHSEHIYGIPNTRGLMIICTLFLCVINNKV